MHYTRVVPPVLVVLLAGPALWGQECAEQSIRARLHAAIDVSMRDTVYIVRDYIPLVFPGVTFYRTLEPPKITHTRVRHAAIVTTSHDTILIREVTDLGRNWPKLASRLSSSSTSLSALFHGLLTGTGFLHPAARMLNSKEELPRGYAAFLSNSGALQAIQPPFDRTNGTEKETQFFVATAEGVVLFQAVLTRDGTLTTTAETIAPYQPN